MLPDRSSRSSKRVFGFCPQMHAAPLPVLATSFRVTTYRFREE